MRDERGQIMPLAALGLLLFLVAMGGFTIDAGQGLRVKRQLQAAADAAALAAARDLPDQAQVNASASSYGPTGANAVSGLTNVVTTVTTKCLARTPNCGVSNAVTVQTTAQVSTMFARVFGLNSFSVTAKATACSPCGLPKTPLDVMFVIDRTGSMCAFHDGTNDPNCTDLANARAGMKAFLQLMDPAIDHVGLALFPPAPSQAGRCNDPVGYGSGTYIVSPLPKAGNGVASDYLTPTGQINSSSSLVQAIDCIKGGGATSYSAALGTAALELYNNGRNPSNVPGLQKVVIFMSDGAANTYSNSPVDDWNYRDAPCHQGIYVSGLIDSWLHYPVYSIGYDVKTTDDGSERCKNPSNGGNESPAITAYQALQQIATTADKFFLADDLTATQMREIFGSIAADTKRGTSALVSDDA